MKISAVICDKGYSVFIDNRFSDIISALEMKIYLEENSWFFLGDKEKQVELKEVESFCSRCIKVSSCVAKHIDLVLRSQPLLLMRETHEN